LSDASAEPSQTAAAPAKWVAGIDVGGTFTDLVMYERGAEGSGIRLAKVPTTHPNQAIGVLSAIAAAGVTPADLALVIHGTTATTNAILERKVARVRADHDARLSRYARAWPTHPAETVWTLRDIRAADPA
jgi:hypothetical protein